MQVTIDRGSCVSCGSCWDTCPELFEQDPVDSFSRITDACRNGGNPAEGTVPESLAACAREAEALCPVQIIAITEV